MRDHHGASTICITVSCGNLERRRAPGGVERASERSGSGEACACLMAEDTGRRLDALDQDGTAAIDPAVAEDRDRALEIMGEA